MQLAWADSSDSGRRGRGFLTAPYHPQSNGKIERWHHSFKSEGFRPGVPLSLEHGRRVAGRYIHYYNTERLHSALGYVTPQTRLEGRQQAVFDTRDRKLQQARRRRMERCHTITKLQRATV